MLELAFKWQHLTEWGPGIFTVCNVLYQIPAHATTPFLTRRRTQERLNGEQAVGSWVCCARKEARQPAGCSAGQNLPRLCKPICSFCELPQPQQQDGSSGTNISALTAEKPRLCRAEVGMDAFHSSWGWGGKAHPSCRSSSASPQLVLEGAGLGLDE